ncbi:glycosyltransferase [Kordiimonas gwangyangensis]|uniref:glycosyltransferase n=1 Tax=Kordiimonas gwangyangensis TaxID=288022 RepID=UPI000371FC69|nr:glycosyltransferase [Kordiimonas gwangyangensis]
MVSFSVITPSLNMVGLLQQCHASIMDQGVDVRHIVADPGSTDGTRAWLTGRADVQAILEKDSGMYDAINKGIEVADGDIVSYLNCDEQYLPGTLKRIAQLFEADPSIDIIFGDTILVDKKGGPIAFRKGYQPRWKYIGVSHLYVLSCTMFIRRRVFDDGLRFSSSLRDVGDADLVIRMLRAGYRAVHERRYFSSFMMTGANMSAGENAKREALKLYQSMPFWVRALRVPLNVCRLVEKALSGAYYQPAPMTYEIYAGPDLQQRQAFSFVKPSWRWPN